MSNENSADGIKPSSKSLAKRTPPARAYRDQTPQIDAATRIPKQKRPNAQKHAVFALDPVLPGEDVGQFRELHSAFIEEWKPSGITEQEAVLSLADLMWRKRRALRLLQAKVFRDTCDPCSPTFDERRGLDFFIYSMREEPETAFQRWADTLLKTHNISYLKRKFPRANYPSTSEWAEAVIADIKSVLLPAAPPSVDAPEPLEPLRKILLYTQVAASIFQAREFYEDELNLRERLDAMIHRQVKHLIQLKAMKQMLRQTSAL